MAEDAPIEAEKAIDEEIAKYEREYKRDRSYERVP